jgi:hypothetical protein
MYFKNPTMANLQRELMKGYKSIKIKGGVKMSGTKYGKYIITGLKKYQEEKKAWASSYQTEEETRILYLGDDVIKGAFYVSCGWFWPAMIRDKSGDRASKPHSHGYNEVVALIGTNPDDPSDLCGEAEITLEGEKHIVNKSCLIYLPAGLEHGPFRQVTMDRPIFQFDCGMAGRHT